MDQESPSINSRRVGLMCHVAPGRDSGVVSFEEPTVLRFTGLTHMKPRLYTHPVMGPCRLTGKEAAP